MRFANLIGFDRKHARKNGLPIGLQLMAAPLGEKNILRVSLAMEQKKPFCQKYHPDL